MNETRRVYVGGEWVEIIISNNNAVLLNAKAEGRAAVAVLGKNWADIDITSTSFAVECLEDITEEFLNEVAMRYKRIPIVRADLGEIQLRELSFEDYPEICAQYQSSIEKEKHWLGEEIKCLLDEETFYAMVKFGYLQSELGTWGIFHGDICVGVASLSCVEEELELGYWIFSPYRRRGYAKKAIEGLISYKEKMNIEKSICAKIFGDNLVSLHLAEEMGIFVKIVWDCEL